MDVTMASLRISLINEAKQLAAAADLVGSDHGYHVPAATIERIHRRLRCVDEPVKVLEWAWRWQRARHDESGWRVDGLAALYLLAALIDLQSPATRRPAPAALREPLYHDAPASDRGPVYNDAPAPDREPLYNGGTTYTLAHID
jgi:hypothetical protein